MGDDDLAVVEDTFKLPEFFLEVVLQEFSCEGRVDQARVVHASLPDVVKVRLGEPQGCPIREVVPYVGSTFMNRTPYRNEQ